MTTELTAILAVAITLGWTSSLCWVYAETRRHCRGRVDDLTAELGDAHHDLATVTANLAAAHQRITGLETTLTTVETERDLRRPANPLVRHVATHGPATMHQLAERFGVGVFAKCNELRDRGELVPRPVSDDPADGFVWDRPVEPMPVPEVDPWETAYPSGWDPARLRVSLYPPPQHRAHLELVEAS